MNQKKAKAIRHALKAAGYAKGVARYISDHPKGLIKQTPNPAFIVGVENGEKKFHMVVHPGTLRHFPATYGALYRRMKRNSK